MSDLLLDAFILRRTVPPRNEKGPGDAGAFITSA
jgi:hypothetical protein